MPPDIGWVFLVGVRISMTRGREPEPPMRCPVQRSLSTRYDLGIPSGVLRSDDSALRDIGEALQTCEQSGDDFALAQARESMGFALIHHDTADSDKGIALLEQVRDQILQGKFTLAELPLFNLYIAREQARRGDRDGVLPFMRDAVDQLFSSRHYGYCPAQRTFWSRRCSMPTRATIYPKPRRRLTGWQRRSRSISRSATSWCCG